MPEADNPTVLRGLIETLRLQVAAYGARDFDDATIAVARQAGLNIHARATRRPADGNARAPRAAIEETEPLKELSMEADATVRELEALRDELSE